MIIFDLDGTLWNTAETTLEAANKIAQKYDEVKEFNINTIENGMGLNAKENAENYMPYLEEKKRLEYLKEINNTTIEIIGKKGTMIYDGVKDTIKKLSKEYKLGIITNNNDEYVKLFFKTSGLQEYFCDYIGALTYSITKGEAIKNMIDRNSEPNSFYVGDIKKDMISTHEAGIEFIHAKYGFEPTLEAEYHINNIKDLEKLVHEIYHNK